MYEGKGNIHRNEQKHGYMCVCIRERQTGAENIKGVGVVEINMDSQQVCGNSTLARVGGKGTYLP